MAASGCLLLAPSDDLYAMGVARIGDRYHVFAPLCEDERIASVQVYDNRAMAQEESFDPESLAHTYWKAENPTEDSIARGWITLGADDGFTTVVVPVRPGLPFPDIPAVAIRTNDARSGHLVGDAFHAAGVRAYPAGADPRTVTYGYRLGSDEQTTLTADEIRKRSKCASNYVA